MDREALIHRYLLGDVAEEDARELDRLLANDPELRQEFVLAAAADAGLREVALERAAAESRPRPRVRGTNRTFRWAAGLGAVAVILASVLYLPMLFRSATIATLASSENAAWESLLPTTPGSELIPGTLHLKSGVATIRFRSGAEVVLEAPAVFELVSPMRGKLTSGAVMVDVPEAAIGFVLETPAGYAVDYGTQFAVRVDGRGVRSDFEVIQGEIAVHHPLSGEQVRLTDPGKKATVSERSLAVVDLQAQDDGEDPAPNLVRIGTNGRTGSAIGNDKRDKHINPEVLSVKRTKRGSWSHRSFFSFDLDAVNLDEVESARLRLNLVPNTRGFASRLPKINRFGVYGLTSPAKADWKPDCLWEDSPGPEDGVLLGTFEIPRSRRRGSFGIQNDELLDFLKANDGGPVTLILVLESTQIAGEGPGRAHTFASDSHPEAVGPKLEFSLAD